MTRGRQAGITFLQLLLVGTALWGLVMVTGPRLFPALALWSGEGTGTRAYFNSVLTGVERARVADHRTPLPQPCTNLTPLKPEASNVSSCVYQPSSSRDFYIVTVTSRTGEVFRYAGRGSP